jgi:hypothetical protein
LGAKTEAAGVLGNQDAKPPHVAQFVPGTGLAGVGLELGEVGTEVPGAGEVVLDTGLDELLVL